MKITPIEIYQKEFRRKTWNGLDSEEVENFLYRIAEGVEAILSENEELRRRLKGAGDGSLSAADTTQALEETHRQAANLLQEARQQARGILESAKAQAEQILAEARASGGDVPAPADDIRGYAETYRRFLEGHLDHLRHWLSPSSEKTPSPTDGAEEDTTTEIQFKETTRIE